MRAPGYSSGVPNLGEEWIVDASQCDATRLRDLSLIQGLLGEIVSTLSLRVIKEPLFHKFEGEGGVTGLYLLGESHLACHTYPEHQSLTLNLYSCTPKARFDYEGCLLRNVDAKHVRVQRVARGATP